MSALAEALLAAQRSAVGALGKAYVAGAATELQTLELLDGIGCTDKVDQGLLVAALDVVKNYGGQAPPATGQAPPKEDRPASDAQWKLIRRLADERGQVAPDGPLTVEQASKVIEQMKAGTYNADAWTVPF